MNYENSKAMKEKLYKVMQSNQSCNGGSFDWTEYLPKKNGKPGKWTPVIKNISECCKGYHITHYWNMWYKDGCKIYEVEYRGLRENNSPGVIDKLVCESVRLIKEAIFVFDEKSNTGNSNTGNSNTGDRNTGARNTGYRNTGNWNTGYRNTGNWNTGNWNTGNWNTGCFNTSRPKYVELFNKPILWEEYKNINFPAWFYFNLEGSDYKKAWKEAFSNATKEQLKDTIELPNFDYGVFEEITGISKKMINPNL